ncbi:MAG: hypothetical protein JW760_07715 [Spirochaetales bacterium]|nr:hypothetical protein [Spirochaetales bacterium]
MGVRYSRAVSIFLLLVVFCAGSYAAGTREDPMAKAEELVGELKYNEAILVLTEVMRKHPDKFDEAQDLLNRIRKARAYYNERYAALIEAYQGNLEDAYPIIRELEELDPDPNEATVESLSLAKETAGFVYNNNRFLVIMKQAGELIQKEQYNEALGVYASGFDLSRDIFDDENYGNILVSQVDRLTEELNAAVSAVLRADDSLKTSLTAMTASLEDQRPFRADLAALVSQAVELMDLHSAFRVLAEEFLTLEADIRSTRLDEKQIHHLIFLNRLIEGRTDMETSEGIRYTLEKIWIRDLAQAENLLLTETELAFQAVRDAYEEGRDALPPTAFQRSLELSEALAYTLKAWGAGILVKKDFAPQTVSSGLIAEKLPLFQWSLLLLDTLKGLENITLLRNALTEARAELAQAEDFEAIEARLKSLSEVEVSLAGERSFWREKSQVFSAYVQGPGDFTRSLELLAGMDERLQETTVVFENLSLDALDRKAEILLEPLQESFLQLTQDIDRGGELLQGLVEIRGEGEDAVAVTFHYPDRALDLFNQADDNLEDLRSGLTGVSSFFASAETRYMETETMIRRVDEAEELRASAEEQQQIVEALIAEAQEKIFLAARYRQEGEQRISEANTLVTRNEFAAAKERLVAAAERFDESLFYQEDPELRALRDQRITSLYEEINDAENALVIREVRSLITQGKSLYSLGNFPQARNVLLQAENRWKDTNVEANPEVEYWLNLTQTALSVTSGREIDETDPLFAEMSQYLNQARADYRGGKDLIDEGKQQEADFYLNRAEKNILYVQQYFPFNKEARVLNMMISKIRDEKQFLEIFKKDFTEARQLISTNPQKAYIDLKDLEAIDPSYPGMSQAILEAEYAAGIKVRPPDRTKINQSARLYDDAVRIYSDGNRAQYPLALSLLDEAIRLNPDNLQAVRLKDTISVETGGRSTSVFSNEDQQVYLEAVNALTSGNYLKASILVDILMQNPDNQRNTKLLELQERIEALR